MIIQKYIEIIDFLNQILYHSHMCLNKRHEWNELAPQKQNSTMFFTLHLEKTNSKLNQARERDSDIQT